MTIEIGQRFSHKGHRDQGAGSFKVVGINKGLALVEWEGEQRGEKVIPLFVLQSPVSPFVAI